MALSGSVSTNSGPYGAYFRFDWSATQSIANNTSTVSWTVTLQGSQIDVFSRKVTVNGQTQGYGYPYDNNYPQENHTIGWTVFSGTTTVYHSADGTGSFNVGVWGNVFYSYPYLNNYNISVNTSITLDTIPRNPATITGVTVNNSQISNYIVAGYSTSTLNISTTLGDAPSISRYIVKYGNTTLYDGSSRTPSFRVPTISGNSASITYKVYCIDSYNLTSNTFTCTAFTAYKYTSGDWTSSPLTQRCVSDGTLNEEGKYAKCVISFSQSKIGTNNITTTCRVVISSYNGSSTTSPTNIVIGNNALAESNSYTVTYYLSDAVITDFTSATDTISVSFHTMNFARDGKGVGIGQAAQSGYFDVNNMIPRFGGVTLVDLIYPVGSYYMTNNSSFNPNTAGGIFDGTTWTRLTGRFLYAAETSGTYAVGQTGGSKNSVAAHTHPDATFQARGFYVPYDVYNLVESGTNTSRTTGGNWNNTAARADVGGRTDIITIKTASEGTTDGNMPPYKAVIMWERTA